MSLRAFFIAFFAIIFFFSPLIHAQNNNSDLWHKGGNAYKAERYDSACYYYQKLTLGDPGNADVYYNLGNAYFKINKPAHALLNYNRALRIHPEHKQARENIKFVESRLSNIIQPVQDIFFVAFWKKITGEHQANTWAWVSLLLMFVTLAVIALPLLKRPKAPIQLRIGLILLWFLCLFISFKATRNAKDHNYAIVMQADVPMYTSPESVKSIGLLPLGNKVYIRAIKGEWAHIQLPDSREAWIRHDLVERI